MRSYLFLSLLLVFTCAPFVHADEAADNLLPNGSFEKLDQNGRPVGWAYPEVANFEVAQKEENHWMRVTNDKHADIRKFTHLLKIKPECKSLEFTARIKTSGLKLGKVVWNTARVMLVWKDAENKYHKKNRNDLAIKADSDWKTYTVILTPPEGAVALEISPGLFKATGIMEIDDIVIKVIDPDAAKLKTGASNLYSQIKVFNEYATFEKFVPQKKNKLAGWVFSTHTKITVTGNNVNHWVRITNDNIKDIVKILAILKIKPEWKKLEVTARIKTSNIKLGEVHWATPRLTLVSIDAEKKYINKNRRDIVIKENSNWKIHKTILSIPDEVAWLEISPGLYKATGTMEVDNIVVKVLETTAGD